VAPVTTTVRAGIVESLMKQTLATPTNPPAGGARPSARGFTGLLLDRVARLGAAHYPRVYGQLGIGKPALVSLAVLTAEGPLRQARLAERTGIDRATLVGVLNELEAQGLARRDPDPTDRRAHAVSATAAGRRLLVRAARLEADDDFFDVLTPAERGTLDALLARVIAAHEA
jgi:DNA-binding MarR family transcriptional regulator